MSAEANADRSPTYVEEVELRGHIIDSLLLPKILDCITAAGGSFLIKQITVGQHRSDPSFALIEVGAPSAEQLQDIVATIGDHGAVPTHSQDAVRQAADMDGAFPQGFYSTTNQRTEVRVGGRWIAVADQEMDCGIMIDDKQGTARCIPMIDVVAGMPIVIGHAGVRVLPEERQAQGRVFEFMSSDVSTEKPKGAAMRQIAREIIHARRAGGKICVVGGPAIVHTGSGEHFCRLIRAGYLDLLLAGNALATHDIEQAMFGTSLGVHLEQGQLAKAGHEHHLRAINQIRRAGGIRRAVEEGILTSGIMYECVRHHVDYLLAGSIRDDGPLPEVVTDVLEAQRIMRTKLRDITFCLMIATTLHSIAVGNLLPSWVRVVCVDINPSTAIKLNDRGSFQTVGLVTDVQPFLRVLVQEIEALESDTPASS
ncbi:MAG: TIGR00300 family protein [Planctomycetales bacterium]|nr:TIGR00300 family protein [Planctomycetales bacterium]NIM10318.1 TIGR00300 family protein [Planctomycetales bacterium]NIN09765.1 TIGR00300 family protein [Planctomycetales bacterium]NIN78888.1 TIGR00300 family protein [Planctomycetales bacterium]NIO36059.1 TIGR00300 family protein [Planctomycetales bacterium]